MIPTLPTTDPIQEVTPTRRFPVVNLSLIVAYVAVFLLYVLPAWLFLGGWFLYQFVIAVSGLPAPANNGVAFFAHVGGFIFGFVAASILVNSGHLTRMKRSGRWAAA